MRNILTLVSIGILLVFVACNGQKDQKTDHHNSPVEELTVVKTYYYSCPMEEHKHIGSDKPGDCSECGMKLVAAIEVDADSTGYYGCPMYQHSHIRHDKAGKCEECSMALKPMKLSSN
jgi:hypothetical protein